MTSASRNPDKRQTHLSWHVGSAGKLSKVPRKGTPLEYMYEAPRNMAGNAMSAQQGWFEGKGSFGSVHIPAIPPFRSEFRGSQ